MIEKKLFLGAIFIILLIILSGCEQFGTHPINSDTDAYLIAHGIWDVVSSTGGIPSGDEFFSYKTYGQYSGNAVLTGTKDYRYPEGGTSTKWTEKIEFNNYQNDDGIYPIEGFMEGDYLINGTVYYEHYERTWSSSMSIGIYKMSLDDRMVGFDVQASFKNINDVITFDFYLSKDEFDPDLRLSYIDRFDGYINTSNQVRYWFSSGEISGSEEI